MKRDYLHITDFSEKKRGTSFNNSVSTENRDALICLNSYFMVLGGSWLRVTCDRLKCFNHITFLKLIT